MEGHRIKQAIWNGLGVRGENKRWNERGAYESNYVRC